jgi:Leucine-rich repeat (LRR) protein
LVSLDLSHNRIEDLTSDKEFFRLPKGVTEVRLGNNALHELPWEHVKNVTRLEVLDIRNNLFDGFGPELTELVVKGTNVYFEGKPIYQLSAFSTIKKNSVTIFFPKKKCVFLKEFCSLFPWE